MELKEQTEKKEFPSSLMEITTLNEIKGELDKILKAINALHNNIIETNNPINKEIIEKDSDKKTVFYRKLKIRWKSKFLHKSKQLPSLKYEIL